MHMEWPQSLGTNAEPGKPFSHADMCALTQAWRSYTARRDYCRQREALRVIGAVLVPLHRARRELRRRRDAHQVQLRAVLAIQAGVRMWLAR